MSKLDISQASVEQKKEMLSYAVNIYKLEIDNFWKRSLFYWGFVGAALVSYGVLYERRDAAPLPFIIACFGIICSLGWTLVNRGSKYWYEAWEQKIRALETEVLGANLFSHIEKLKSKGIFGGANYSVSQITIALSDTSILVWLILAVKSAPYFGYSLLVSIIVTAIICIVLLIYGRSNRTPDGA